ncbi:spermidine/putrescine ABC transporter substrate-binding protein [Clostridium sp. cel8]|jgi:spermidine/putrescine-binding protein|uniref:polyamine ABC transporter substrate-binding protein n=1 Tax=unclassified Clostridium TaxID=2614128 RepID=UPI0015F657F9|nr:spermidine/putrescine ABC transporter substrate-binding protein [Clostridium sp. cel8]MBA5850316.1 spermidine/putrescine ABC transporter substrate-binding protein [Clostridium sp. cel8]
MKKIKSVIVFSSIITLLLTGFTGCGSKDIASKNGYAKEIHLYNWTEYMPDSVLKEFEKKYGIKVVQSTYSSNEEMMAKLIAGGTSQYDIAVPSNYFIKALRDKKLIQPIDKSKITNLSNISSNFLDQDFDKGNKYSVPYMMSMCVIAVNKKKLSELGVTINSYNDLLNPKLKENIVLPDDQRECIGIALKALGYTENETDKAKINEAAEWLNKLKPNVKAYDGDSPKTLLISNEVAVGVVWNAEAALAMRENEDIEVIFPEESSSMSLDSFVILAGSKHKKEAELFINFVLQPKISKMISDVYPYSNPNEAAKSLLSKEYIDNPASNLPESEIKKGEFLQDVGDSIKYYDSVWTKFKN